MLRVPMVPWVHLRQPSVPHFTPLWGEPFQLSPLDRDQQIFNPRPTFHLSTPEAPVLCSMTLSCPCTFQHHPPPPPGSPHRHRQTFNWQPPTLGRASRLWVLLHRCQSSSTRVSATVPSTSPVAANFSTTNSSCASAVCLRRARHSSPLVHLFPSSPTPFCLAATASLCHPPRPPPPFAMPSGLVVAAQPFNILPPNHHNHHSFPSRPSTTTTMTTPHGVNVNAGRGYANSKLNRVTRTAICAGTYPVNASACVRARATPVTPEHHRQRTE